MVPFGTGHAQIPDHLTVWRVDCLYPQTRKPSIYIVAQFGQIWISCLRAPLVATVAFEVDFESPGVILLTTNPDQK